MIVMLDIICMDVNKLWGTGNQQKTQNENMSAAGIKLATSLLQAGA